MPSLHITNGDCAADTLRLILRDPVTTMADVLHEGPCPPVDGDAWHALRARFLAAGDAAAAARIQEGLAAGDRVLADACRRGDELVLWFEHDLFDQLAVIRTLDLIARAQAERVASVSPVQHPRVSLICIDRFPGIDRFIGLGQLSADQLSTLSGTGVPVIAGHFALAQSAWRAFRSPDPTALVDLARQLDAARVASSEGGPPLTFLGDALLRFLAEYPCVENGLSRTEALALRALLAGTTTAGALFAATQTSEPRPFMGDLTFFDILERLASGRVPLVTVERGDGDGWRHRTVGLTPAGRDVLDGRADYVRLNGIDVWRGGVHLAGSDRSPWRWDAHGETLVS
jgi:hypothetical protein